LVLREVQVLEQGLDLWEGFVVELIAVGEFEVSVFLWGTRDGFGFLFFWLGIS
jgi:hypothetical protein